MLDLGMRYAQLIEVRTPRLKLFPISDLKADMVQARSSLTERDIRLRIVMLGQSQNNTRGVTDKDTLEAVASKGPQATEMQDLSIPSL